MSDHRKALNKLGLDLASKPLNSSMPTLPQDPISVSDAGLMELYFELTEWGCYARAQAVDAAVSEQWAEKTLALQAAEAVRDAPGKTLADRRSAASLTGNVRAAEVDYVEAWALRKALDEAAETAERRAAALSRELSRRGTRVSKWSA